VSEFRLERRIALRCTPDHAYAVFVGRIDLWWPRGHRRDPASTISLEPEVGGRLVERAGGQEWLFGTVTALEPPHRLAFDWYPGSPAAPTAVEIGFGSGADGAEVVVVHRAVHPEARAAWPHAVARFAGGWDALLPGLRDHCNADPQEES
jgi:uncharacterized protein YndB with AHSA1/START domain